MPRIDITPLTSPAASDEFLLSSCLFITEDIFRGSGLDHCQCLLDFQRFVDFVRSYKVEVRQLN